MSDIDVANLRKMLDDTVTQWAAGVSPTDSPDTAIVDTPEKPVRTDGKRAVRTKNTGDRVYLIDDNTKSKAWVTTAEILSKLGFEMNDVQDLDDSELVQYTMMPSIYGVDE